MAGAIAERAGNAVGVRRAGAAARGSAANVGVAAGRLARLARPGAVARITGLHAHRAGGAAAGRAAAILLTSAYAVAHAVARARRGAVVRALAVRIGSLGNGLASTVGATGL